MCASGSIRIPDAGVGAPSSLSCRACCVPPAPVSRQRNSQAAIASPTTTSAESISIGSTVRRTTPSSPASTVRGRISISTTVVIARTIAMTTITADTSHPGALAASSGAPIPFSVVTYPPTTTGRTINVPPIVHVRRMRVSNDGWPASCDPPCDVPWWGPDVAVPCDGADDTVVVPLREK